MELKIYVDLDGLPDEIRRLVSALELWYKFYGGELIIRRVLTEHGHIPALMSNSKGLILEELGIDNPTAEENLCNMLGSGFELSHHQEGLFIKVKKQEP